MHVLRLGPPLFTCHIFPHLRSLCSKHSIYDGHHSQSMPPAKCAIAPITSVKKERACAKAHYAHCAKVHSAHCARVHTAHCTKAHTAHCAKAHNAQCKLRKGAQCTCAKVHNCTLHTVQRLKAGCPSSRQSCEISLNAKGRSTCPPLSCDDQLKEASNHLHILQ